MSVKNTIKISFLKIRKLFILLIFFIPLIDCSSQTMNINQKATWIWYPGDFEIFLNNKISSQRQQRGVTMPLVWPMYHHFSNVCFKKNIDLQAEETVELKLQGDYFLQIDYDIQYVKKSSYVIPKGKHELLITILNDESLPCFWLKGKTVFSDSAWVVTAFDKKFRKVGYWNFDNPDTNPSEYKLKRSLIKSAKLENTRNQVLVDFGKETFGYLKLKNIQGKGDVRIFYGESLVEASSNLAETVDEIKCNNDSALVLDKSRAFRYVRLETNGLVQIETVEALYEYQPLADIGSFSCSDTLINKIWAVSDYTFRLTSREFFIDGIKRDRWLWSGDAIQSYMMNYYTHNDHDIVKRTITALRGKEPIYVHINTILDYSFFWIISVYDYYLYSGDKEFITQIYPKVESLMRFCSDRLDVNGFVEGKPGDWVFVDWTKQSIPKDGELSFEQILYYQSLVSISKLSAALGNENKMRKYTDESTMFLKMLNNNFITTDSVFAYRRVQNKLDETRYKQANIISVYFKIPEGKNSVNSIKKNILLNPDIPEIITPYMKFYELSALCELNEHDLVLKKIRSFWGGMLKEGATTFWETYDPTQKGDEHFMENNYGRPFSKSLCHNWGASPLYILGRYFLGVKPLSPGYKTFIVEPQLGDLKWIQGVVPINDGQVTISVNKNQIKVRSNKHGGICRFKSNEEPKGVGIAKIGKNYYQFEIKELNKDYVIGIN